MKKKPKAIGNPVQQFNRANVVHLVYKKQESDNFIYYYLGRGLELHHHMENPKQYAKLLRNIPYAHNLENLGYIVRRPLNIGQCNSVNAANVSLDKGGTRRNSSTAQLLFLLLLSALYFGPVKTQNQCFKFAVICL